MEIWKELPGYNGYYEVSNLGKIRRISRFDRKSSHLLKEKELTPQKSRGGYLMVTIRKNGKGYTVSLHRLIALAFLENPNGYKVVHHKNSDRTDNRVENLEWCTHSYNSVQNECQYKRQLAHSIKFLKKHGYTIFNNEGEIV